MQREEVTSKLSEFAFDFFFWFSRFEFALKESGFLKSHKVGNAAEPGWDEFTRKHQAQYALSAFATRLLELSPQQQVVGLGDKLEWAQYNFPANATDLQRVVRLLQIVRNNLFHGGKHGEPFWDNPPRTELLLVLCKTILDEIARLGGFDADYRRYY